MKNAQRRGVRPMNVLVLAVLLGMVGYAAGRVLPPTMGPFAAAAVPTSTARPTLTPGLDSTRVQIAQVCATQISLVLATPTPGATKTTANWGTALGKALAMGFIGGLCSTWEADPPLYLTAMARTTGTPTPFPAGSP